MCPAFLSAMEQIIFECLYVALGWKIWQTRSERFSCCRIHLTPSRN
jgi:hypothetical protein